MRELHCILINIMLNEITGQIEVCCELLPSTLCVRCERIGTVAQFAFDNCEGAAYGLSLSCREISWTSTNMWPPLGMNASCSCTYIALLSRMFCHIGVDLWALCAGRWEGISDPMSFFFRAPGAGRGSTSLGSRCKRSQGGWCQLTFWTWIL